MLISKKNRQIICKDLFENGVICAPGDMKLAKHPRLDVPNLHVIKLMQSFTSKELVKAQFNWRWHYWFLTNEGIEFLREYLHVGEEVTPKTLQKSQKPLSKPPGRFGGEDRPRRFGGDREGRFGGDREGRFGGDEAGKKVGPPSEFKPRFEGAGRGRPAGRGQ